MKSFFSWAYIIATSAIAGCAFALAVATYIQYDSYVQQAEASFPTRMQAIMRIEEVSIDENIILGMILSSPIGPSNRPVRLSLSAETFIAKRPDVAGATIDRFPPPLPADVSDLTPGALVLVRIALQPDSTLLARYILLNDPLTTSISVQY